MFELCSQHIVRLIIERCEIVDKQLYARAPELCVPLVIGLEASDERSERTQDNGDRASRKDFSLILMKTHALSTSAASGFSSALKTQSCCLSTISVR